MVRTRIRKHWVMGDALSMRTAYRGLWHRFLLAPTDTERERVAHMLDALSASRTDRGWYMFLGTLPGYWDFWKRLEQEHDHELELEEEDDPCKLYA